MPRTASRSARAGDRALPVRMFDSCWDTPRTGYAQTRRSRVRRLRSISTLLLALLAFSSVAAAAASVAPSARGQGEAVYRKLCCAIQLQHVRVLFGGAVAPIRLGGDTDCAFSPQGGDPEVAGVKVFLRIDDGDRTLWAHRGDRPYGTFRWLSKTGTVSQSGASKADGSRRSSTHAAARLAQSLAHALRNERPNRLVCSSLRLSVLARFLNRVHKFDSCRGHQSPGLSLKRICALLPAFDQGACDLRLPGVYHDAARDTLLSKLGLTLFREDSDSASRLGDWAGRPSGGDQPAGLLPRASSIRRGLLTGGPNAPHLPLGEAVSSCTHPSAAAMFREARALASARRGS